MVFTGKSVNSAVHPSRHTILNPPERYRSREGNLNLEEFTEEVRKLAGGLSKEEISVLYEQADENKDGTVQWEEFTNWVMNVKFVPSGKVEYDDNAQHTTGSEGYDSGSIESAEEKRFAEQLELTNQLTAILKNEYGEEIMEPERERHVSRKKSQRSSGIISYPYTPDMAKNLLTYVTEGKRLDYTSASALLTHFQRERAVTCALQEIDVPANGKLIVVGDTHGHLEDVVYILHEYGPPSPTNVYLVNGDIADRGVRSCEIFFVLFTYSLACPGCVYFNRGNHENEVMNTSDRAWGGGFYDEVAKKYDCAMYDQFQAIFLVLGLCTIINDGDKKIFVVHGGLCRIKDITLKYLSEIRLNLVTAPNPHSTSVRDQVFSDILWSDPQEDNGKQVSSRGLGILWGPDVTKKFLSTQNLDYMIRSHECPANNEGFKLDHGNKCVTIFSASNYLSRGNYACVLIIHGEGSPDKDPKKRFDIAKHFAPPLEFFQDLMKNYPTDSWSKACLNYRGEHRDFMESARAEQELVKIKTFLILYKPEIYADLLELKQNEELKVTEEVFVNVCTFHINEEFNWKRAIEGWKATDADGNIDFAVFLNRFHIRLSNEKYSRFKYEAVKKMYETFIEMDMDMEQTIKIFDKNNDGFVDFEELTTVLKEYDLGLSESQTKDIARSIFVSHNGGAESSRKLKVDEFLERFSLVHKSNRDVGDPGQVLKNDRILGFLGHLMNSKECNKMLLEQENAARLIQGKYRNTKEKKKDWWLVEKGKNIVSSFHKTKLTLHEKLQRFFIAADENQDGLIDVEEFVQSFARISGVFDLTTPSGELVTMDYFYQGAKALDTDGNGRINYLEFLSGFQPGDSHGEALLDELYENICTVLFRHHQTIRAGCTYLDKDKSGKISTQKFIDVIRGINRTLTKPSRPFHDSQIKSVCESCSLDGMVDYLDVLQNFVLSDSADQEMDQFVVF